ncbi:unnamed protein product [Cylicocyclus nassatus]|uniref:Uncharacterized protein n=1 Tax=Cylicocyclus nassatus TaxID=53992 RepID=A0AA36MDT2_CYLNA|nr:unnamed protein product [Cylicocyclus nassatus]
MVVTFLHPHPPWKYAPFWPPPYRNHNPTASAVPAPIAATADSFEEKKTSAEKNRNQHRLNLLRQLYKAKLMSGYMYFYYVSKQCKKSTSSAAEQFPEAVSQFSGEEEEEEE